MIRRGDDLLEAEERFKIWCDKEYPDLREIFTEMEIKYPNFPTEKDINDELRLIGQGPAETISPGGQIVLVHVVPDDVRDMMKRERVRATTSAIDKIRKGQACVYDKIWSKCAVAIQEKLRLDERFVTIRASEDPLGLWKLVREVAATGVHVDKWERVSEVRVQFTDFAMVHGEDLERYKRRFEQLVRNMEQVNLHYEAEELAQNFIYKLDDRFARFKETIRDTGTHTGALHQGKRPATLDVAYTAAQQYLVGQMRSTTARREPTIAHGALFHGKGKSTEARGEGGSDRGDGESRGEAKEPVAKTRGAGMLRRESQ
jgi:hypothetical protein